MFSGFDLEPSEIKPSLFANLLLDIVRIDVDAEDPRELLCDLGFNSALTGAVRAGEHTDAGCGQSFRLAGALSASLVPLGTLLRVSILFITVNFPLASSSRNSPCS